MSAWRRALRFYSVGAAGTLLQLGMLAVLVDQLQIHYGVATALALALTLVHNFVWHARWTWRDRRPGVGYAAAFVQFVAANGGVSIAGTAVLIPLFVEAMNLPPVAANALTIAACGVVNFWLASRAFAKASRSAVIAELQLDAEVACPQEPDRLLQVVLRSR
jgi:putative flippase GtrA